MNKLFLKTILLSIVMIITFFSMSINIQAAQVDNPISTSNFNDLVEGILDWVLGIAGSVALLMIIAGGIMYATAAGNEEKLKAAKKVISYAILGVVIVILSYSIIKVLHGILT